MQVFLQEVVNGLALGIGFAMAGIGLTFVFGILRVMTFAHGEFYALGAYGVVAAASVFHASYWVAAPLSMLFAWLLATFVYVVIIRPAMRYNDHGIAALVATYGLSLVGVNLYQLIFGPSALSINMGLESPIFIKGIVIPEQELLVTGIGVTVLILLALALKYSTLGRVMRAVAQNQYASALVGIRVRRVQVLAFAIGSVLAALAGILYTPSTLVTPDVGQNILFTSFVVVILGGLGSVGGAAAAGIILGLVQALGGAYLGSQWTLVYAFGMMMIVLAIRPSGLGGGRAAPVGRGYLWPRRVRSVRS